MDSRGVGLNEVQGEAVSQVVVPRRELYRGGVVRGPSLHDLTVSLTFAQQVNGPKAIPVAFVIDPHICQNDCDFGAIHLIVCGMQHTLYNYREWQVVGRLDDNNIQHFAKAFALRECDLDLVDLDFEVSVTYSIVDRTGTIAVSIRAPV